MNCSFYETYPTLSDTPMCHLHAQKYWLAGVSIRPRLVPLFGELSPIHQKYKHHRYSNVYECNASDNNGSDPAAPDHLTFSRQQNSTPSGPMPFHRHDTSDTGLIRTQLSSLLLASDVR